MCRPGSCVRVTFARGELEPDELLSLDAALDGRAELYALFPHTDSLPVWTRTRLRTPPSWHELAAPATATKQRLFRVELPGASRPGERLGVG